MPPQELQEIATWLHARGWLADPVADPSRLCVALRNFQAWAGLSPTGSLTVETKQTLIAPRVCGLPDQMVAPGTPPSRWPRDQALDLTWTVDGSLRGFTNGDLKQVYSWAWAEWMRYGRLRIKYNPNQKTAQIIHKASRIDGPNRTLGLARLPYPGVVSIDLLLDLDEPFVFMDAPPADRIDLGRVVLHEGGHVLGLPHFAGFNSRLMDATYSPFVGRPGREDIAELQIRYPFDELIVAL